VSRIQRRARSVGYARQRADCIGSDSRHCALFQFLDVSLAVV
jgi:hypothetical protein